MSRSNRSFLERADSWDAGFPMEILLHVDRSRRGVRQHLSPAVAGDDP